MLYLLYSVNAHLLHVCQLQKYSYLDFLNSYSALEIYCQLKLTLYTGCYVSTNNKQNMSRDVHMPCWGTKPDVMRPVSACHDLYRLSVKRESQDNIPQITSSNPFIHTDGP